MLLIINANRSGEDCSVNSHCKALDYCSGHGNLVSIVFAQLLFCFVTILFMQVPVRTRNVYAIAATVRHYRGEKNIEICSTEVLFCPFHLVLGGTKCEKVIVGTGEMS